MKFFKALFLTTYTFFKDKYTYRASALAFTTLLALVPLLAVTVFLMAKFPIFSHLVELAKDYLLKNFVPTAADTVVSYFENFVSQASHLPSLSILFLLITAILLVDTIEDTVNDIWEVKARRKRIRAILSYFIILFLTPLLIGLTVLVTSFLATLTNYIGTQHYIEWSLAASLPVLINTFIFSLIYIYAPYRYVSRFKGILGAFLAAVLFEGTRMLFAFYLTKYANYQLIYGAFAVFPIFLIWIYLCWVIFLWGALFTYTYSVRVK